ncbi:hypothetical protein NHH03_15670 [Stieleria sp. TO1_6]|uniref:hypothetical protein n=1 Tax=Stieleria tagensis TaxID=2956795 RepID=UPI00209B547F|nr:hypothetical protein [Stieleria tagensis]MCO8123187.1 hypothetical protein [Stieleria tagensis]
MQRKPLVFTIAALLIGAALSLAVSRVRTPVVIPLRYKPTPELDPQQVVARQLEALQSVAENPEGFLWCYQFAAPSNREFVGSVQSFASMLQTPTYLPLLNHQQRLIGRALVRDADATVMATIIHPYEMPAVFRFILRRQSAPPYEDCWMTTSVFRTGAITEAGPPVAPRGAAVGAPVGSDSPAKPEQLDRAPVEPQAGLSP